MSSGEIQPAKPKDQNESSAEVEFALVLLRIISSVNEDQEQLRHTIYDLARYKLMDQLRLTDDTEKNQKSVNALETAIRGVEEFSQKKQDVGPTRRYQSLERGVSGSERISSEAISRSLSQAPPFYDNVTMAPLPIRKTGRSSAIIGLIGILIAILSAIRYREMLVAEISRFSKPLSLASSAPAVSEPAAPKSVAPAPSRLLPTSFGVYGVSDEKLFELDMLPSKAQDMRVSMSPTVAVTKQPVLPNGRVKFIVYRREAALSIPDRAEVRIISKVVHAISFDAAGKQVVSNDDGWYIRNISFPYRVAPIKENPAMFEIRPENDGAELSPGRYALVLKTQVFDFIVDGKSTDPRHCLERLTAANGTFVSECKGP
jgi:hypothetical protein